MSAPTPRKPPAAPRRSFPVGIVVSLLVAVPLFVFETGMIADGSVALVAQPRGQIVDFAPRRAVDNARLALVPAKHLENLALEIAAR